ncbi:MAG: anaerobic sulfatase-maturation protein [Bacteroidales bacterium]|nr:anaerobic sulfatase-maturation protein [Bacteroidales bacterium]
MKAVSPYLRPFSLMLKPAGARCNLACRYCYYLDRKELYPEAANKAQMDFSVLETAIRQYIEAQPTHEVVFVWHGGEPTLLPLGFYRKAMRLEQQYAQGHLVSNCLQTNGTLLTDDWCRFLHDEEWLVGVSIDGPEPLHDAFRRMRGGGPTFRQVMSGIEKLQRFGVQWNAMSVVNSLNAGQPEAFYSFFKSIGCQYLQFTPIVERNPHTLQMTPESVSALQWGGFCNGVFDVWWEADDVGQIFVQLFDATLANWVGEVPGVCTLGRQCGHALAMEWNGEVYSCDHFVSAAYRLGNIREQHLADLIELPRQRAFGQQKETSLPRQCRECRWLQLCRGECPKNRLLTDACGEPGLNWLCEGYRMFFEHTAPYMQQLKNELNL